MRTRSKIIIFLIVFIIAFVGVMLYIKFQEFTMNWKEVTLYFKDETKTPFTDLFVIENNKIKQDEGCDNYTTRIQKYGSGKKQIRSQVRVCIHSFKIYKSKDNQEFKIETIQRYEIKP